MQNGGLRSRHVLAKALLAHFLSLENGSLVYSRRVGVRLQEGDSGVECGGEFMMIVFIS